MLVTHLERKPLSPMFRGLLLKVLMLYYVHYRYNGVGDPPREKASLPDVPWSPTEAVLRGQRRESRGESRGHGVQISP